MGFQEVATASKIFLKLAKANRARFCGTGCAREPAKQSRHVSSMWALVDMHKRRSTHAVDGDGSVLLGLYFAGLSELAGACCTHIALKLLAP